MKLKIATLLITALLFQTCTIIDPAEPIPAYIHVEPFTFSVNTDQGSSSSKITDGWVYVGGEFLGAYTLPATFPVIAEGDQEVLVDPGIKDNGIAALPNIYKLYERYTTTINLAATRTDTIRPSTSYIDGLQFLILEGFENSQNTFSEDLDGNDTTKVETTTTDVFEGQKSGIIQLTENNFGILVGSQRFTTFPPGGTPVYVEMDYKTDIQLAVGIYGYDLTGINTYRVINRGVNANEEWNKIYFNFTEEVRQMSVSNIVEYQIVLSAILPSEQGSFTLKSAEIRIDNVKLVMKK